MNFNPKDIQAFTLKELSLPTEDQAEKAPPPEKEGTEEEKRKGFNPLVFQTGDSSQNPGKIVPEVEFAPDLESEKIALAESFRNTEFSEEKSELTNAEEYARKIREGADLYFQRMQTEADTKHEEVQKILKSANVVKQEADAEKEKLLEGAQTQVQEVKDAAYKEGFAAGEEAGTQQRYNELAPQIQQIDEILKQLARLRQIVRFQGEEELLQLAILVAKKVVNEELTVNPDVIYNIVRSSLQEIEALGKIRILVHPGDYDFLIKTQTQLEAYLKEEQTLVIESHIDSKPGELLVETDETIVNFYFQKQFDAIEELLKRKLHERQTHLHDVDMDAHDFTPPFTAPLEDEPSET